MNFFERQAAARRSTRRLIVLFALAVLGIVAAIDLVVLVVLGTQMPGVAVGGDAGSLLAAAAPLLAVTSLATLAVIGIASLIRIGTLRSGGAAVARSLGANRVEEDTRDPQLKRLRNIVEEVAIAACTPVPAIYVLDDEAGINAFAAGYAPADAVIAVTRGALDRLNRDELQGVIAHEFSHLLNGDTRLNIQLMGLLFGILVIGVAGRKILQHGRGSRDSKDTAAVLAIALALMVVGYIGLFFGRLIKAAVSRSREYLADASAVQFTRQTAGLAGALKKIAGIDAGSRLGNADTEEVSHMLFGDGVGYASLWATHPPVLARIRALEPTFDARQLGALRQQWRSAPPDGLAEDRALGFAATAASPALPSAAFAMNAGAVPAHAGQLEATTLGDAARIHAQMPPALLAAARSHDHAMPLLCALLLDRDRAIRDLQLQRIGEAFGTGAAEAADVLRRDCADLHPLLRLPLAALAFPALRRRPAVELQRFAALCEQLIHADGQVGLFEYCLGRLLERQLFDLLDPSHRRPHGRRKLGDSQPALATVFAVLAANGHADAAAARRAFNAGMHVVLPNVAVDYRPPRDWAAALDTRLDELDRLEPMAKQLLIEGLAATCSHDGRISVAEAELLRTICACLHCPLPPLLGAG